MSTPASSRLAAVERHPEWERLRRRRPPIRRHQIAVGCGVVVGLMVTGIALVMAGAVLTTDAAWSALFILPFALGGLGIVIWLVTRWRRFVRAPLLVTPALVIDKRLHVWGGGSGNRSHTNYHVTLELNDDARKEFDVDGKLYGLLRQDDCGVAWIKEQYLLDFHALSPLDAAEDTWTGRRMETVDPPLSQTPPPTRRQTVVQPASRVHPEGLDSSGLALEAIEGPLAGRRIRVDKTPFQIGAGPECDLRMAADDFLSNHHATIDASGGQWLLFDRDSTNGTFVDHHKLASGQRHMLRAGQSIRVGASEFRVVLGREY